MELSKPLGQGVVEDIPEIAQHYLVCGIEECKNNCQFYCNSCHLQICEKCSDYHQKRLETKNHEIVSYRKRKRKLPVEKCKDHPSKDIDMICEDCQVILCSKCVIRDHRGHIFADLETLYSKNFTFCLDKIYEINQYHIPTSQYMKRDIKEDCMKMKAVMDKIRASINAEAESIKRLVEKAMSDNLEQANKMEETLLEKLNNENKTYDEYKVYLENLVKEFQGYLLFEKVQSNPIVSPFSDHLNIKPIPETTAAVYPVFTAGQYSKDDVAKLFGKITIPFTKPESRKIKPMETTSTHLKQSERQKKQNKEKSEVKQTLSLSSSVTKVTEYTAPGVDCVYHLSLGKSGRLWVDNGIGKLVQTDQHGSQLHIIKNNGESDGYHTVTKNGYLIYTDKKNNVINKITLDRTISEFIKTGDWKPLSIHSSNINGDILVGMRNDEEGKVTRYNKAGNKIQNIQRDNEGQQLYSRCPHHITENVNSDICVSDFNKHAVVVVDKTGQHRFSYASQKSEFCPSGICTDILGHILVCDIDSNTVHILDQDGQFLSLLLTSQQGIKRPRSVSVNNENNLYVGQNNTNTVTVFKYLH